MPAERDQLMRCPRGGLVAEIRPVDKLLNTMVHIGDSLTGPSAGFRSRIEHRGAGACFQRGLPHGLTRLMIGLSHRVRRSAQFAYPDANRHRHGLDDGAHERLGAGLPAAGCPASQRQQPCHQQDGYGGYLHGRDNAVDMVELCLGKRAFIRRLHGHDIVGLKGQAHLHKHGADALSML